MRNNVSDETSSGTLLAVVGPSGSGKDSLINWLQQRITGDQVCFARRTVTRPASPHHEDHAAVDDLAFAQLAAEGAFAVTWSAHGLCYGLPQRCLDDVLAGKLVIANGSRRAMDAITSVFPQVAVAEIGVEPDVLAKRLRQRGRESEAQIKARLVQPEHVYAQDIEVFHIDNSKELEVAGHALLKLVDHLTSAIKARSKP